jgi:hypothetical protein
MRGRMGPYVAASNGAKRHSQADQKPRAEHDRRPQLCRAAEGQHHAEADGRRSAHEPSGGEGQDDHDQEADNDSGDPRRSRTTGIALIGRRLRMLAVHTINRAARSWSDARPIAAHLAPLVIEHRQNLSYSSPAQHPVGQLAGFTNHDLSAVPIVG